MITYILLFRLCSTIPIWQPRFTGFDYDTGSCTFIGKQVVHTLLQHKTADALGLRSFPGCYKNVQTQEEHTHTHTPTTPAAAKAMFITASFIRMRAVNSEGVLSANSSQVRSKRETETQVRRGETNLSSEDYHYGDRCCFCTLTGSDVTNWLKACLVGLFE